MSDTPYDKKDPAHWEQRYVDGDVPWDSNAPDAHLRHFITDFGVAPCATLEIGCGTGTNAIWLAAQGFDVVGIDVSSTAIDRAQKKIKAAQVTCRFRLGHALEDDIPEAPFQFIYDRGVFHIFDEAKDRVLYAHRAAELLEPDGLWHSLIGSTDGPPRDSGPPRRSATDIASAVEPHFEILKLTSTAFDEGRHAHARAFVLVARRRTS